MPTSSSDHPESFYARLFAKAYDPVMRQLEERLLFSRRQALIGQVSGKGLEVGAGTGVNFPLYPSGSDVLAIEPSEAMLRQAARRLDQYGSAGEIKLMKAGINDSALDKQIAPHSLDFLVCTLVLCTIPDLEVALDRFRTWLRPGGRLLVMEHIHDDRQPQRWLQHKFTPVWKRLAEGCHLNRATDQLLKSAGFRAIEEQYIHTRFVPFYWAVLEPPAK
ncbi:MAG: methyltransferase domain-containing protein [Bacteroidetes bacterium]|jgi:SAM-dependent methyltransferase|nr:methyltransferase domain-containing protein [Bacteroidota bacterium]